MNNVTAVHPVSVEADGYDEGLLSRFINWRASKGGSLKVIARMLNRGEKIIGDYVGRELTGETLKEIENDVRRLLTLKEDFRYSKKEYPFCQTEAAVRQWEVLQFTYEEGLQGIYTAPSGSGKTTTGLEFKKQNISVILITADVVTRKPGNVLKLLARVLGCCPSVESLSNLLQNIKDCIRHEKLLIVDDSHFLSWEALECFRSLWDEVRIGMTFLGQPRLYDLMRGNRSDSFLYDQIFSRISIRRSVTGISREDVRLIADSICPRLDRDSIDFLFKKGQDQGHFRNVINILRLSLRMSQEFNCIIESGLLKEAAGFLMV